MITSVNKTSLITPNIIKKSLITFQGLYENFSFKFMFDAVFPLLPN